MFQQSKALVTVSKFHLNNLVSELCLGIKLIKTSYIFRSCLYWRYLQTFRYVEKYMELMNLLVMKQNWYHKTFTVLGCFLDTTIFSLYLQSLQRNTLGIIHQKLNIISINHLSIPKSDKLRM